MITKSNNHSLECSLHLLHFSNKPTMIVDEMRVLFRGFNKSSGVNKSGKWQKQKHNVIPKLQWILYVLFTLVGTSIIFAFDAY